MISFFWLLLACLTTGSGHVANTAQFLSASQPIPSDTRITLERTGCEGSCPIYRLTISARGVVVYEGRQFVRKRGRIKSRIDETQLRQLIAEFEKANYFSLGNRYQGWDDGCPESGIDYPSAITSLTINGKSKTILHDYGCREKSPDAKFRHVYPKALFELEQRIDEIVGTRQWRE